MILDDNSTSAAALPALAAALPSRPAGASPVPDPRAWSDAAVEVNEVGGVTGAASHGVSTPEERGEARRVAETEGGRLLAYALAQPSRAKLILEELRACKDVVDPAVARIVAHASDPQGRIASAADLLLDAVESRSATPALASRLLRLAELATFREGDPAPGLRLLRILHGRLLVGRAEENLRSAGLTGDVAAMRSASRRIEDVESQIRSVGELARSDSVLVTAGQLIADLRDGKLQAPAPLIEGMLLEGDGAILYGPPGVGKSQLALRMAVALSAGGAAVSHLIPDAELPQFPIARREPVQVLVVSAEDNAATVAVRVEGLCNRLGIAPADLSLFFERQPERGTRSLADPERRRALHAEVRACNAQVVVLDNLTVLAEGIDRSDDGEVREWLSAVVDVLRNEGRTVLLVGHTAKEGSQPGQRSDMDRLFGSFAWNAWADSCLLIDADRAAEGALRLTHVKARRMAKFERVLLTTPTGDCHFELHSPGDDAPTRNRLIPVERFLEALPEGGEVTKQDICAHLSCSPSTFDRSIQRWLREAPRGSVRCRKLGRTGQKLYQRVVQSGGDTPGREGGRR